MQIAATRVRDEFANKVKMEEQVQKERDNIAREREQWNNELKAAARQNREMAQALLQVGTVPFTECNNFFSHGYFFEVSLVNLFRSCQRTGTIPP